MKRASLKSQDWRARWLALFFALLLGAAQFSAAAIADCAPGVDAEGSAGMNPMNRMNSGGSMGMASHENNATESTATDCVHCHPRHATSDCPHLYGCGLLTAIPLMVTLVPALLHVATNPPEAAASRVLSLVIPPLLRPPAG